MKLGQLNFIVLILKRENGHLIGTLSRPKHFATSNGLSFSEVSADTVTASVVRSSVEDGHLRLVVQNRADKRDEDDYEMALTGENQATLKPVGFPFDAWKISKVEGKADLHVATNWDANRFYTLEQDSDVPNVEMKHIFDEDQKDRQSANQMTKEDWEAVDKRDAQRRQGARKLLATGQLHAAKDFGEAAFVFQHGDLPDDYLLAHTLAVIAIAKGDAGATWIAAATLDRYLQSTAKPQIYGTQFETRDGQPSTQEPYNRDLISDALRQQLGVPSLSNQEEQRKRYDSPATQPQ
jgi:hypothetical protein